MSNSKTNNRFGISMCYCTLWHSQFDPWENFIFWPPNDQVQAKYCEISAIFQEKYFLIFTMKSTMLIRMVHTWKNDIFVTWRRVWPTGQQCKFFPRWSSKVNCHMPDRMASSDYRKYVSVIKFPSYVCEKSITFLQGAYLEKYWSDQKSALVRI